MHQGSGDSPRIFILPPQSSKVPVAVVVGRSSEVNDTSRDGGIMLHSMNVGLVPWMDDGFTDHIRNKRSIMVIDVHH